MEINIAHAYGTFKRSNGASPSSSGSIDAAIAAAPYANLLPREDPQIAENARRAAPYDEVREKFHAGLLGHEILELFPNEQHWMPEKMGEWEVVFRREQVQFIEVQDKPAPTFTAPKMRKVVSSDHLPLPELEVDKPHMKAVAIKVTIWRSDTGEGVEELVWFPRSQIKNGKAAKWIEDKKREEIEARYPVR